jgi:hypothetical protein
MLASGFYQLQYNVFKPLVLLSLDGLKNIMPLVNILPKVDT